VKFLIGIGGGLLGIQVAFVASISYIDDQRLKNALESGSCLPMEVKDSEFVDRPSLVKDLKSMLTPIKAEDVFRYFVISGEHATGKTTMIRNVSQKIGSGVIYVDVPDNIEEFGQSFASATGYNFYSYSGILDFINGMIKKQDAKSKKGTFFCVAYVLADGWYGVYSKFKTTAAWYRQKYGKAPVLIFDNINRLAAKHSDILEILQDGAKDAADNRAFITVFVSSDGLAPVLLKGM
jgi:AAA+ ATPase superfamily predicted ATPase